jgi:hypothetical protein
MKYRHVLLGTAILALLSFGLLAGSAFGSPQPTPDPTVDPSPTASSAPEQCDVPSSPDPSPTPSSPTGSPDASPAFRLVSARLAAAPGDTIVLTIDLKTGKYVKDESSAHFDNANTYTVQYYAEPGSPVYTEIYYTLPDGKFCAPSVMLPDGTIARQSTPQTKAPKGYTKVVALSAPAEGKLVIKWVQTRP